LLRQIYLASFMPHHAPNVFENEWEVEGTYEGRSGVIAQLGEVLNMGPVVLRADIGAVQKLGERGTENLELNAHKKRRTHASHNHG